MGKKRITGASILAAVIVMCGNTGLVQALPAARSFTNTTHGDVFLGGEYIELGLSQSGSFGTTEYDPDTEESVALPDGFFGTAERDNIGMSTNPAGFGEEPDLRMDFFMPGSPEERWSAGYKISDTPYIGSNSLLNPLDPEDFEVMPTEITDNTVTDLTSGNTLAARSLGTLNSILQIKQDISFEKSQKFFKNVVTLKNVGGSAIDEVRFMRSFDPDNTVDQEGDYSTHNYITKTHADGDGAAMVVADTNIPEADPVDPVYQVNESYSPIFFYTTDSRARVYIGGFTNPDVYDPMVYENAQDKGYEENDDIAIGITVDVGTLAAGAESTFTYYTSLDNRDISEVLTDIEEEAGVPADVDEDNIPDFVEDAGPNGGDANGDGTPDSQQTNVTSVPNEVVGGPAYVALEMTGDCSTITELSLKSEISVKDDGEYNYPLGLADFASACATPGGSATIKIFYDKVYDTSNWVIRKYLDGQYFTVPGAVLGTATVGSTQVTTLTYTVVDGGELDDDGLANAVIVDPAGPAVLAATAPDTGLAGVSAAAIWAPLSAGTALLLVSLRSRRSSKHEG